MSMLNRRTFLRTAAVAGGAALAPGLLLDADALTPSKYFSLTDDYHLLFRDKYLKDGTVMQSFAIDSDNNWVYAAQVTGGSDPALGNLTINKLDINGNLLGWMKIEGCGHGAQIAVQNLGVGNEPWLWMEYGPVTVDTAGNGYGSRIMRCKFQANASPLPTSAIHIFDPFPNGDANTCAIDPVNRTIVVRHKEGSLYAGLPWKYSVFMLADLQTFNYTPLITVDQPTLPATSFQGYALFGDYLYMLNGNLKNADCMSPDNKDCTITRMPITACAVSNPPAACTTTPFQITTAAGIDICSREPEGMCIQIPDPSDKTKLRICYGFGGKIPPNSSRTASVYYKDVLVGP